MTRTLGKSTGAAMTAVSLILVTTLFDASLIGAKSLVGSPSSKTVTGKVSAVEGEFRMAKNSLGEDIFKMVDKSYIITTPMGQEVQLNLTSETKVPNRANLGDRVEAQISDKGRTLSVMLIE